MSNNSISPLISAELSRAAYGHHAPEGWRALHAYSGSDGANSFTTYIDSATKHIVVAFKGTDLSSAGGLSQLQSDLQNDGGSAWEGISGVFGVALAKIEAHFTVSAGYTVATDGHSLGGGLAQTAALEFGLSGYGQNALPVSGTAIATDAAIVDAGGFALAEQAWAAHGNTFSEVNAEGDPATLYYSGGAYLDSNPVTLSDTFAASEFSDILTGNAASLVTDAYDAHAINTVIQLERSGALPVVGDPIESFLAAHIGTILGAILNAPSAAASPGSTTAIGTAVPILGVAAEHGNLGVAAFSSEALHMQRHDTLSHDAVSVTGFEPHRLHLNDFGHL
jgi:hypothetical protein